jgi:hypothetical protein
MPSFACVCLVVKVGFVGDGTGRDVLDRTIWCFDLLFTLIALNHGCRCLDPFPGIVFCRSYLTRTFGGVRSTDWEFEVLTTLLVDRACHCEIAETLVQVFTLEHYGVLVLVLWKYAGLITFKNGRYQLLCPAAADALLSSIDRDVMRDAVSIFSSNSNTRWRIATLGRNKAPSNDWSKAMRGK